MNLFIDAGNSCIKYLCLDPEHGDWQQAPGRVCTGDQGHKIEALLNEQWQALGKVSGVYISDVGGHGAMLEILSQALWQLSPRLMKTRDRQLGLLNGYYRPQDLGDDRWLALLAAHSLYHGNKCVIDCGTAVTVDLLSATGQHQGGMICPGAHTMLQSLARQTRNISLTTEESDPGPWGRSTQQCVSLGVALATRSFISEAIEQARAFFKDDVTILVCGGQSEALVQADSLIRNYPQNDKNYGSPIVFDQNLVLKGVAVAAGFKICE